MSSFLPLSSCLSRASRSLPSSLALLLHHWLWTDEQGDALLSDLETTTSHMPRSGAPKERTPEPLASPLSYGQPQMGPGESSGASEDKDHLYSTVCKPRSPKPAAPAAPPFSSSSGVLGTGLCELDRLLQELNATQFNITDEIMSQFPSSKETAGELKEDQSEDKKRPSLRWLLPWALTGTQSTSVASVAGSPSEMRVSMSARAARTAARTSCSCSLHAARAAKAPSWITTFRRSVHSGTQTVSSAGQLFRARGPPAVREPFPREAWFAVRYMWPPCDRPLCLSPGPSLPPGPLHLHLLPARAHQGLLPRACRQAVLPALLPQALRLTACEGSPHPSPVGVGPRPQRPRPDPRDLPLQTLRPCSLSLGLSSAPPCEAPPSGETCS
ncbi:transforming growth factor beta-1-induced transcript 1 protein isoform X9 [Pteropus alecto]|uniref:transforming growth factor beta-1-induced transcript 1 protein isoform X9 n=1 Tax=Pteropus alecto TaxID=9402 RepID=UPI000D539F55|nr:transforming growth factor beta-1-induced transcript 1 protein isoform X9 [Pteropus alecto]